MKLTRVAILLLLLPFATMAQDDKSTLTKLGESVPKFSFEIERGKTANIDDYKGKLILINLFATWCPPCNTELPLVQKQIWEKYSNNPDFAFFVFGREEGWDKLEPFKKAKGFTFPILPDVDRSIFSKFATQSIPRNIIIDQNGKIIYQSIGFSEKEFAEMVALIDANLKKTSGS
ncbi:Thiol-disulfide oxidoreductase ResA [compost metagenome]